MAKHLHLFSLLMFVSIAWCEGQEANLPKDNINSKTKEVITSDGPKGVTRTIIQDKKGNIWMAAFDGVFKYDPSASLRSGGKSFANITSEMTSSPFFSILEDKKGNFWFGSIGSGVYHYDGKSLQNFTTTHGLSGNQVTNIYEDKTGNIWFVTENGLSSYNPSASLESNGISFKNYKINEGLLTNQDDIDGNAINAIVEDKSGKFWFGTRGRASIYDGKTFTVITHEGKPFWNVRSIIKDKKGNIWLGGDDGLWRYDPSATLRAVPSTTLRAESSTTQKSGGSAFTNFSKNSIGYIYEDKKGYIWTSSQIVNSQGWAKDWVLSRYDEKSLSDENPTVKEIKFENEHIKGMTFGILEAKDGTIWFGALDGVYRYDGNTITDSKGKEIKNYVDGQ